VWLDEMLALMSYQGAFSVFVVIFLLLAAVLIEKSQ